MGSDHSSNPSAQTPNPPTDRRKWQAPKLTEYGHIGKLTQGTSGTKTENTVFKSCL